MNLSTSQKALFTTKYMLMLFVFDPLLLLCIAKELHLLKKSWLLISS